MYRHLSTFTTCAEAVKWNLYCFDVRVTFWSYWHKAFPIRCYCIISNPWVASLQLHLSLAKPGKGVGSGVATCMHILGW